MSDYSNVKEKIYKRLYEIKAMGLEPEAAYLGHNWLRALDELTRKDRGYYGERISTFAGVPLYEVVGHHEHFYVAVKEVQ